MLGVVRHPRLLFMPVIVAIILAGTASLAAPAGGQSDDGAERTTTTAEPFDPAENPGYNNIIGSPEAGPDPEHAGDRGGWMQLALLGAIAVGAAVVLVRVARLASRHS